MRVAEQGESLGGGHRVGGLLWQRNFRLLWFGETVSEAGNAMAVVGMPLLAVTVLLLSGYALSGTVLLTRDLRSRRNLPAAPAALGRLPG